MCDQPHMHYKDHGSTTKDADCECNEGFHFENEDQRACVPNRECDKGYGQGEFGRCLFRIRYKVRIVFIVTDQDT